MKHRNFLALLCAVVLVLGILSALEPTEVSALSSDEIQSQIDALEEQNQQIRDQLDDLEQQKSDNYFEIQEIVEQKNNIDQQISLLNAQIRVTNEQIAAYSKLIADKQVELDDAQARFEALNEKNKERIRAMEEDGTLSYWSVLFKANSFSDFLDRLNMVQEIAAADQRRLAEMSQAANEVSAAKDALMEQKSALEQTRLELNDTEAELQVKRQESNDLLTELVAKGEEYQRLIEEGEAELDERLLELAQKEIEHTNALWAEWEAAHPTEPDEPDETEPDETDPDEEDPDEEDPDETEPEDDDNDDDDDDYPASSSTWLKPCDYVYVSSPFSDGRLHPILGYVRPHNGIDLAAYLGNPVYASRSGYVTVADYEGDGAGNYVFINHGDGFSSVYMHMDYYIVSVGEYVSAGEVIGYVGTTGLSEGPHLHFGIAYNGTYVNPANYIDF